MTSAIGVLKPLHGN